LEAIAAFYLWFQAYSLFPFIRTNRTVSHDKRMKKELTKELTGDLYFAAGKTWCERIPIFLNIFLSAFQGEFY